MEDYESQYEEYKNTLLHETWFRKKLNDLYRGSLTAEKEYIDENGVLWKIGLLGAVCGFLIAFTPVENGNWILGIFLILGIIGSVMWARHIGNKFKKKSAEMNFYAFKYDRYFKDRIQEDKRREMEKFDVDLTKTVVFMQRCASQQYDDPSEVIENFQCALRYVEDLEKRYNELSRYDCFAGSLKNDWYFNAEIQKDIDKYI